MLGDLYTQNIHDGTISVVGQLSFAGFICSMIHCNPSSGALSLAFLGCANDMAGTGPERVREGINSGVSTVVNAWESYSNEFRPVNQTQTNSAVSRNRMD